MSYPKIRVLPTETLAEYFAARGRHSLGHKVWFTPTEKDGKFVLRGQGYDTTHPEHKVLAFPTERDGKLEFRSITSPLPVTCAVCWTCVDGVPTNPVDSPVVRTTIDVMLDNFVGGLGCCDNEFSGIQYPLVACVNSWMPTCVGFDRGVNCPVPGGLISPAFWYGHFTGTYGAACDPYHPGELDWDLHLLLTTYCEEDMTPEQYWAHLQMYLSPHDSSHPNLTSFCCMALGDSNPVEGQGRAQRWEACWPIEAYEMCGDFASHVPQLCACDDAFPCDCVDFYLLETA